MHCPLWCKDSLFKAYIGFHGYGFKAFVYKMQMFMSFWRFFLKQSSANSKNTFGRLSYFPEELNPLLARRIAELEIDLLQAYQEIEILKANNSSLENFLKDFTSNRDLPDFVETSPAPKEPPHDPEIESLQ